jgi:hypothetical protein
LLKPKEAITQEMQAIAQTPIYQKEKKS